MPTKKDILLFLKAVISWHKEFWETGANDKSDKQYRIGFIKGLEHAYKTIKGLK